MDHSERESHDKANFSVPAGKGGIYHELFLLSQNLIAILDSQGFFKEVNPRWQSLLGYTEKELLDKPFIELVSPLDREVTLGQGKEFSHTKEPTQFKIRILTNQKQFLWIHWRAFSIGEGSICLIGNEITEEKITEQSLEILQKLSLCASQTLHIETLSREILKIIGEYFEMLAGELWIIDQEQQLLRLECSWCENDPKLLAFANDSKFVTFKKGEWLPGRIWENQTMEWFDLTKHPLFLRSVSAKECHFGMAIGFPIIYASNPLGVALFFAKEDRPMVLGHEQLLNAVGREIGSQIGEYLLSRTAERRKQVMASIVDSSESAIIGLNLDGMIVSSNKAAEKLYGYRKSELINQPVIILYPRESQLESKAMYRSILKAKEIHFSECKHLTKEGKLIDVSQVISPIKDDRNLTSGFSILIDDITERKQIEEELSRINSLQNAILENSLYMIISCNEEGVVQLFNRAAERNLGYTSEEVVGKQTPELWHDHGEIEKRAKELADLGVPVSGVFATLNGKAMMGIGDDYEWTFIRKDGTRFPTLLTITPIKTIDNKPIGFVGMGRDITEKKKLDRLKNEFVSTVSHELRTPLASIKGAIGLLLGGKMGPLSPESTHLLTLGLRNCDRLIMIINDILDLEKISGGHSSFKLKNCDIIYLIETAIEMNHSIALQNKVTLEFLPHTKSIKGLVEPNRFIQVMVNLLSNAIKFSSPDGKVIVKTEQIGEVIRINVIDHGLGIPTEFYPHIFEKFAQFDASDSRKKGGTGLGLSIAKAIVEKFGGQIGFTSTLGKGTTFYIDLLISEKALSSQTHDGRILICEMPPIEKKF